MKIKSALASVVVALGMFGGSAYGYVLSDGTDVGGLDTFVASIVGLSPSNPTKETEWASGETGLTLTYSGKTEPADFVYTTSEGIIAFKLETEPSYFLVKDARTHVLFKNEASIDWGVFNLFDFFENKDELQLSHLTEFTGGDIPVPEPGTALLLATGIFGLVASRKRMKKSA